MTTANVTDELGTELDIEITQGATYTMMVTATGSDGTTPFDLAGYKAHMQIRRKAGSPGAPIVDLSSLGQEPDIILAPPDDNDQPIVGGVEIRIPATQTSLLKRACAYDLFLIDENDPTEAIRLLFGNVTVSLSVTVNA